MPDGEPSSLSWKQSGFTDRRGRRKLFPTVLPNPFLSLRGIFLALALGIACAAAAQPYPSRPIRIVVAAAPGGGADFVARLMGGKLTEALGQQVFVENRAGAGSTIGYEFGVKAPPDGYTLTMMKSPTGTASLARKGCRPRSWSASTAR